MKVHVVNAISSGEVRTELDEVSVYTDLDAAKEKLKEIYDETIRMVDGFEIVEDELNETTFDIQIADDYDTVYHGEITSVETDD